MYSHRLSDVLDDIVRFLASSQQEVLILDLQHFFKMTPATHAMLRHELLSRFDRRLIPRSATPRTSMQAMWDNNWQLVVIYGDDLLDSAGAAAIAATEPFFWARSNLQSKWFDTPDIQTLKAGLDTELHQAPSDQLLILQAVLTPNLSTILLGSPSSLEDLARPLAPLVRTWISRDWAGSRVNVVIVDWYNQSDLVGACIGANGG